MKFWLVDDTTHRAVGDPSVTSDFMNKTLNFLQVTLQLPDEIFQNVVYVDQGSVQGGACDAGIVIPRMIQSVGTKNVQSISLVDIAANQMAIIDNQTKIITSLAQVKASLDFLNTRVVNLEKGSRENVSAVPADDFFKPVESQEMLDALEASLMDDTVVSRYIKSMSHICGSSGKEDGLDCCYRLIDHFVTRQFLTTCSWTGISRENSTLTEPNGESEPQMKVPLMAYKHTRQLFLKLILQADNSFTAIKCEAFFKRVLKNSKQRVLSKTVSKHKNRPKNLQYAARHREAQPTNQLSDTNESND